MLPPLISYGTDALGKATHAPSIPPPVLASKVVAHLSHIRTTSSREKPVDLHGGQTFARTKVSPSTIYAMKFISSGVCRLKWTFQLSSTSLSGMDTVSPTTCGSIHVACIGPLPGGLPLLHDAALSIIVASTKPSIIFFNILRLTSFLVDLANDLPILQDHDFFSMLGYIRVMGDHDNAATIFV